MYLSMKTQLLESKPKTSFTCINVCWPLNCQCWRTLAENLSLRKVRQQCRCYFYLLESKPRHYESFTLAVWKFCNYIAAACSSFHFNRLANTGSSIASRLIKQISTCTQLSKKLLSLLNYKERTLQLADFSWVQALSHQSERTRAVARLMGEWFVGSCYKYAQYTLFFSLLSLKPGQAGTRQWQQPKVIHYGFGYIFSSTVSWTGLWNIHERLP